MLRCLASCWELFEHSVTIGDGETMPAVLALPVSEYNTTGKVSLSRTGCAWSQAYRKSKRIHIASGNALRMPHAIGS